MHSIRAHPRLAALAAGLLALLVVVAVAAVRSRTAGCTEEAPRPNLPAELRALGGFDQAYDATMPRALTQAALDAASAFHPDLAAATSAGDPVAVAAGRLGLPDAIVVPLGTSPGPGGAPRAVEGLAIFLRGCGDRAYLDTVADLAASPPPAYPAVPRERAVALLGVDDPQLVYVDSPVHPLWRDPRSGRTVSAT